jgi:hypothetical protein
MGIVVSKSTVATVTFSTPQEIVINKADDSITSWQGGTWNVADVTGTVSLPTGAATAAKQDTGNTSLSSIDTKVSSTNTKLDTLLTELEQKTEPANEQKVVVYGTQDNGTTRTQAITWEGHSEVAIHDPLLPFGSVHTENATPIFQADAVYGINNGLVLTTEITGGTASASDSMFTCSTGTSVGGAAVIQSRKRLRYRPGQGVLCRFAGLFTTPVSNSYQLLGCGHAEDGYYFGYQGTTFGILHVQRGGREVRTLTVTTASSTTESVTVKLNGVDYTVAVTNSGNINRTVWEISQGTFSGWRAEAVGSTVRFIADSAGAKSGAYSLTGTTAVGTFAQTKAGVASTDTFIAQSSWNGDKLTGTGASGVTIDPTKNNAYSINIQSLGAGAVVFKVLVCPSNANNITWVTVHTIRSPNTMTTTHVGNPSFPFTMTAYSAGSTTNLTVKCGSFVGFIEGQKKLHGNRFSYINTSTAVGSGSIVPLFTIKNDRYYGGRVNQSVVNLLSVLGAIKHTSPVIYYLIKNGSLTGNPVFTSYATNSVTTVDTAATAVSYSTNDQIFWTGHLGDTGELDHTLNGGHLEEVTLQPGEWITLGAKATTGTPSYVTGSVNTREDQ